MVVSSAWLPQCTLPGGGVGPQTMQTVPNNLDLCMLCAGVRMPCILSTLQAERDTQR